MRKLEIGSGNRPLPGYEHLDIDPRCPDLNYCCSMMTIPVQDSVFDEIRSVHSIEHISWREGRIALKEWYRILKPQGLLYIATPNLRWIAQAYLNNNVEWKKDFDIMHVDEKKHQKIKDFYSHTMWANFKIFSSQANGDDHKACYDAFMLKHLLEEVGFKNVKVILDDDSLIVEARK